MLTDITAMSGAGSFNCLFSIFKWTLHRHLKNRQNFPKTGNMKPKSNAAQTAWTIDWRDLLLSITLFLHIPESSCHKKEAAVEVRTQESSINSSFCFFGRCVASQYAISQISMAKEGGDYSRQILTRKSSRNNFLFFRISWNKNFWWVLKLFFCFLIVCFSSTKPITEVLNTSTHFENEIEPSWSVVSGVERSRWP